MKEKQKNWKKKLLQGGKNVLVKSHYFSIFHARHHFFYYYFRFVR